MHLPYRPSSGPWLVTAAGDVHFGETPVSDDELDRSRTLGWVRAKLALLKFVGYGTNSNNLAEICSKSFTAIRLCETQRGVTRI